MADLPIEGREGALRASVAAVAEGRPVEGVDALIAAEREALGPAWDGVRAAPDGPADDPLVRITPEDIDGVIVARGGYKGLGDITVKGQGWGLVKFIWRHGEESRKPPEYQVSREDLLAFPRIIREHEARDLPRDNGGYVREWRAMLPGSDGNERLVVFADNALDGRDGRHLVTLYVQEPNKPGAGLPPSPPRARTGPPGSPGKELEISTGNTAPDHVARPGSRRGPASQNMGRRGLQSNLGEVYDTAGRRLDVRYEVVEADDLIVSHTDDLTENARYPQEMQPRDRTRAASSDQIRDIVARFEPALLTRSRDAATGAPIVGPDGVVESGNGRTLALRRIYRDRPDQATRYQALLTRDGFRLGGVRQPVLIARRLTDLSPTERRQFTVDAQKARTLDLSPSERAMADARLLDDILEHYRGGDPNGVANAPFRRAFVDRLPQGEQGALLDARGDFSAQGTARFRNALLARAFDDSDLLATMLEQADDTSRALSGALYDVAPAWARMRAAVKAGEVSPDVDATGDLLDAVRMVRDARAAGRPLDHLLSQIDAFHRPSPATDMFLTAMLRGRTTAGRDSIADTLRRYVDEAMKSAPASDMFGAAPPTAGDLLRTLSRTDPTRPSADAAEIVARVDTTLAALPDHPAAPDAVTVRTDALDAELARLKHRIGDAPDVREAEALVQESDSFSRALDAAATCLLKGGLA